MAPVNALNVNKSHRGGSIGRKSSFAFQQTIRKGGFYSRFVYEQNCQPPFRRRRLKWAANCRIALTYIFSL